MNAITYRFPKVGDENQIGGCMWASGDLWELTDGTPASVAEGQNYDRTTTPR